MSTYIKISVILLILGIPSTVSFSAQNYEIGNPVLTDLWVDPVNGNDANSGASQNQAVKTITAAWNQTGPFVSTGYRINLLPGVYPCEPGPEDTNCINYFADRAGTYQFPLILRAYNGPNSVTIRGGFNFDNVHYLYLIDLNLVGGMQLPTNSSGNNLLHLANSDYVLLRRMSITGPACASDSCNNLQEVLKVNQTQHLYVENSTIGGAWHSSVDYMVVQYGHFLNNRVHTAGQWCMYIKGGASYLHIEGNEFGDTTQRCQLGFQAGQSANFAMMQPPWLHYETYDIKFVNNLLHDIPGVGMSVSGGYNILFAYNTLYRVGTSIDPGYGLMHFIFGERNCTPTDELPRPVNQCKDFANQGGWGPTVQVDSEPAIPNRNVYVYNNIFYNPAPEKTAYVDFEIPGPIDRPNGFQNSPDPARSDDNLVIRGNLIWNGPVDQPLGVEEADRGCQASNPTCNESQLRSDNAINILEPQLVNPGGGDFRPTPGGNVFNVTTYVIPDFTWNDAPSRPAVPQGNLINVIALDRDQNPRNSSGPPGAYIGGTTPPSLFTLTVTKGGTGSGTVTSSPSGIDCGSDCSEAYNQGTGVTLTATPASGSTFVGWSGDADCSDGAVTMNADKTCTATFDPQAVGYTLTVIKSGTGSGTVTSSPSGINCGSDCSETYSKVQKVKLTAKADTNSTFTGWSGGGCTGTKVCTVTVNAPITVTASYAAKVPDIAVSLESLDFGGVKAGKKLTKTLKITNNGTGDLTISIDGIGGTEFSISGSSTITIKSKKSYNLKVTFRPTSTGSKTATLEIHSNDPDTSVVEVAMTGIGQ